MYKQLTMTVIMVKVGSGPCAKLFIGLLLSHTSQESIHDRHCISVSEMEPWRHREVKEHVPSYKVSELNMNPMLSSSKLGL